MTCAAAILPRSDRPTHVWLVRIGLVAALAAIVWARRSGPVVIDWLGGWRMAVFLAFAMAEWATVGPPRDWVGWRRALAWQWGLCLAVVAMMRGLIMPLHAMAGAPLLRIGVTVAAGPWGLVALGLCALGQVALYDLATYWSHRALHHLPWLWRFHRQHHAVVDLDAVNNCAHPVDTALEQGFALALGLVIGLGERGALALGLWNFMIGCWIHTRGPFHFGPLGVALIDSRAHAEHHRREPPAQVNFGNRLTLWDRVFGTWRAPGPGPRPAAGLADHPPPRRLGAFVLGL